MSDGFTLGDGVLERHVAQVDAVHSGVREAAAAGRPLDRWAYGAIGQVFAIVAADAAGSASASVALLASTAGAIADGLRAGHEGYRRVEEQITRSFGGPP